MGPRSVDKKNYRHWVRGVGFWPNGLQRGAFGALAIP